MADAAVEFLLNNLKELVDHHSSLIKDSSSHIAKLQSDLLVFNAYLKDLVEKQRDEEDKCTKVMVKEIREVVYEVEDIIDTYVNNILAKKAGTSVFKFLRSPIDLQSVCQQVESVRKRVEEARANIGIVSLQDGNRSHQYSQHRPPRKKDVVGFEDEAEDLINRLTSESDHLEVISIIGMLGLGKTTLAWKVFKDPAIIHKFPIRIWLSISQEFSDRDIFLSILKELTRTTEDINSSEDNEIADLVIAHLERTSFLIVMDDVRESYHWDRLKAALPVNNNKGKVLITSRHENVGRHASGQYSIKKLRYFTHDESWELLRLEALHTLDCPPELEGVGRVIAKNCNGLPLAVVITGGILAQKFKYSNISTTAKEWEDVSTGVSMYLSKNDAKKSMRKLISLSYDGLPYHLRSCFLYLGMFPEDYEIPVSKLIRLWIAEGFIQQKDSCSLEETALMYLDELINRNLIEREKVQYDGKVITCRIHEILRDFCRTEAANEFFFKEISFVNENFNPPISDIDKYRRLAVHSNCLKFISSKPSCPHARSFVCFSKDKFDVSDQDSSTMFAAFKFLRVLDVQPFKFEKIDTDLYQLVYMRYLVLSSNLSILPSKFSQLWNIQTLIVETTSRTLQVKADIWKMSKLRYFKTNASAILPKPTKSSEHGKELQTLSTISVESCTLEVFNQASNLKKLSIRGGLGSLLDGKIGSFESLGKMKDIEELKLINDVYPRPSSKEPLRGLPPHHQFPSGLLRLTLHDTHLSWGAISTLGFLENLKVLKLKKNAFMGATWKAVDGGFKCLELLHIDKTDLIVWKASALHYPKLRSLVLRNCSKLLAVPISLADIPCLQMLDLYFCNPAAASARAIKEAKKRTQAEGSEFMLSISPSDEGSILTGKLMP